MSPVSASLLHYDRKMSSRRQSEALSAK